MTNIFATMTADQQDALAANFEADFGVDWEEREGYGERFLSEHDLAAATRADEPTQEDWDAFFEMTWCDPAERALG